jgi:sigma-B regulation protein RsbU (phosphoserine phosphatase)
MQYFTMVYGVLGLATRDLCYVTAGHPGPVQVRRDAAPIVLESGGLPVGLLPEARYEERTVRLEPGDRLYFATDGLTDAENTTRQEFGVEKLLEAYDQNRHRALDESLGEVMARVEEWCAPARPADDVAMLAIECQG